MENISGFGLTMALKASNTFPAGIDITQFADDSDPVDSPELIIAETSVGLNGDLLVWSKANPINITVALIPKSDDDVNMAILFEANRVAKNKLSARDVVTATISYPDGSTVTLGLGAIIAGQAMTGVASAGRYKTKVYRFVFEAQAIA